MEHFGCKIFYKNKSNEKSIPTAKELIIFYATFLIALKDFPIHGVLIKTEIPSKDHWFNLLSVVRKVSVRRLTVKNIIGHKSIVRILLCHLSKAVNLEIAISKLMTIILLILTF